MAKEKLVEKKYLFIFILITSLFALWGFANDITNPMVAAFQTVMELSAAKASLVQFAFYGGYATMAIPAALFIRRHSYKSGILLGLALYATGAFLFIPAAQFQEFSFFCLSLYILTFGLAFLETTANPFILSLGSKSNATRRLNLSQSFNPMGSLLGMSVASFVVLPQLISDRRDAAGNIIFPSLSQAEKADIRLHDLAVIRNPYVIIGIVVVIVLVVIALAKVPWIDHDLMLSDGALASFLENSEFLRHKAVIAGTVSRTDRSLLFGGRGRRGRLIEPDPTIPVPCHYFDMSLVLVPAYALNRLENPSDFFRKSILDYGYGPKVVKAGVARVVAPGIMAKTARRIEVPSWKDPGSSLKGKLSWLVHVALKMIRTNSKNNTK